MPHSAQQVQKREAEALCRRRMIKLLKEDVLSLLRRCWHHLMTSTISGGNRMLTAGSRGGSLLHSHRFLYFWDGGLGRGGGQAYA